MRCPASLPAIALLCLLAVPAGAAADGGAAAIVPAADGDRLLLRTADGDALLAGIRVPVCIGREAAAARRCREALETVRRALAAPGAALREVGRDRWHRPLVAVAGAEGTELAEGLVAAGLALVDPLTAADGEVPRLLAAERRAREQATGIWGAGGPVPEPAGRVRASPLRFTLVCGRVRRTGDTRYWFYLNFGADRRDDFTVRMAPAVARALRQEGVDPRGLAGREICVRGWIFEAGGPMIEVVTPLQIGLPP